MQLHGVATGWRCEVSMEGYGVVMGGSMGAITRCDHGVALRGLYGVVICGSMGS